MGGAGGREGGRAGERVEAKKKERPAFLSSQEKIDMRSKNWEESNTYCAPIEQRDLNLLRERV